jgi:hypothetical protein
VRITIGEMVAETRRCELQGDATGVRAAFTILVQDSAQSCLFEHSERSSHVARFDQDHASLVNYAAGTRGGDV